MGSRVSEKKKIKGGDSQEWQKRNLNGERSM